MRKAFLTINAGLTLALITQLYFAAVGHFSQPEDEMFRFHTTNGRIVLPLLIILWIVFGFFARIGRQEHRADVRLALLLLTLQSVYFIVAVALGATPPPNMTTPGGTPFVLGLHGLGGTLLLLLTIWVFFRVRKLDPITRSIGAEPTSMRRAQRAGIGARRLTSARAGAEAVRCQ